MSTLCGRPQEWEEGVSLVRMHVNIEEGVKNHDFLVDVINGRP